MASKSWLPYSVVLVCAAARWALEVDGLDWAEVGMDSGSKSTAATRSPLLVARSQISLSQQSCNTQCQEEQTNCALRCDQDEPCIRKCREAAVECTARCIPQAIRSTQASLLPCLHQRSIARRMQSSYRHHFGELHHGHGWECHSSTQFRALV